MITVMDLRAGNMAEFDNILYRVVSFQHVKPGKGGGFVRLKLKNVEMGTVTDKTLDSWESVKEPPVEEKEMQYLYKQGDKFVFMDTETYEQLELTEDEVGEGHQWLKDEMAIEVLFYKERPISVKLPITVNLKVASSEPGIKGDRVSNATKPATLETGAEIQVPLFVKEGDTIKVDTRTGEYIERV
ncbi:MAG TPA: elongation factor P [bacterium]|nr:elongation factor P [bacterium]